MTLNLVMQFLVLTVVVSGLIILALYLVLIRTVDGAKQRFERDAQAAREREAELNKKIQQADVELKQRKGELDILEKKMRQEMEEQANKLKEEMLNKARAEAEDIIVKAQKARDLIRREIEKNMELKIVDYSSKITNDVLSQKVKEQLDLQLIQEFLEQLQRVDFSKIGAEVKSAQIITAFTLTEQQLKDIHHVFTTKLGRNIVLDPKINKDLVGGALLQFETLMLDGSLSHAVRESALSLKQSIEKQYV